MSKILHICLAAFYIDNYSYQENILPKYHKKMGYEVEILASTDTFNEKGEVAYLSTTGTYYNENDIKVTRIDYKYRNSIGKKLKIFPNLVKYLEDINPDILFIHGCQFYNTKEIRDYAEKNNTVVFVDNHADFSNSATNWISKNLLHKYFWRHSAKNLDLVTKRFFGVLPARVDFLKDIYKIPEEKIELLVMGGDDELIDKYDYKNSRKKLKEIYNINDSDFLVVTAGKIDKAKLETFNLIKAVKNQGRSDIKLLIFGSVTSDLEEAFNKAIDNDKIIYGGWISNEEAYEYFSGSDVMIFPGRHSVYWEQSVAMARPIIVKKWPGTEHVNVNGNAILLENSSIQEIQKRIEELYFNSSLLSDMSEKAKIASESFKYSLIAKKSLMKGTGN